MSKECNCDCCVCIPKLSKSKMLTSCLNYNTKYCYIRNEIFDKSKLVIKDKKEHCTTKELIELARYAAHYINYPDNVYKKYGYDVVTVYFINHYYSKTSWNFFTYEINKRLKCWIYDGYEKE